MKIRTLLTLLAAALILSGCARNAQDGKGRLRIISLSADTGLKGSVVTRAEVELEGLTPPADEEFSLAVKNSGGTEAYSWTDITSCLGQGWELDPGSYTATALCGDIEQEGFGYPCFGVTEPFTILNEKTTQVPLVARLMNMAVTVGYSPKFKGYFPTHNVVISRGGAELADFSTQPDGSIAFIKPAAFKAVVSCTYQNGRTYSNTFDVNKNIAACTWQKIFLDVDNAGSVSVTVTWNDDVETIVLDPIETGDEEETNP